jgi:hypothetical protein
MKMEPRLQEKATSITMREFILSAKRLLMILRIIWAYTFESKSAMDSNARPRIRAAEMLWKDMTIIIYVYIFLCKVETNPSRFVSSVKLT